MTHNTRTELDGRRCRYPRCWFDWCRVLRVVWRKGAVPTGNTVLLWLMPRSLELRRTTNCLSLLHIRPFRSCFIVFLGVNLYGEVSQKAVGSKSTKTSHLVHEISTVMYDKSRNQNTASSCGVRDERSTIGHESTSTIHHRLLHESCSLKTETIWRKVENGTATKCQPRSVLSLKRTSGNSL